MFFPLLLVPSVGSCVCCIVLHKADKRGKKNKSEGAMLRTHQRVNSRNVTHFCNTHRDKKSLHSTQEMCRHYTAE